MRKIVILAALGSALTACNTVTPEQRLSAVHQPVVTNAQYVFDAAAPGGSLPGEEAARLDGWFSGMGLGFGDSIYVGGDASPLARAQVAQVAGRYGLLIADGTPVAAGMTQPGVVRVVVQRNRAFVPGCPDWSRASQPDVSNAQLPNFGCGVNANLAAQVANPEDLVHGSTQASAQDAETAAKAIIMYRNWPLTGVKSGQSERALKNVEDTTRGSK